MTERTRIEIAPIVVPPSLEEDHAGVMAAIERIGNAAALHDAGTDDLAETAAEILPMWQPQADFDRAGFTASRDGEILGIGAMYMPTDGTATVTADIWVDPERWGEGIEEALLAAVEEEARHRGRSTIQSFTLHRPDTPGPRLNAPTGHGSVPADDRQTRFMRDNGFTLSQVERNSAFDLQNGPFDRVERLLASALEHAGPDYRLLEWTVPTPEEYLDGFATVRGRLATDMPAGELVIEEEIWDADRVRRREARFAAMGLTVSVAAVQHVPTGAIAAYNDIGIGEPDSVTNQFGTLVLPEHRGHRLGMIVKCANILRWRTIAPHSPKISTFNAEENAHMLAINIEVGFVPVSYAGAWQKTLSASS